MILKVPQAKKEAHQNQKAQIARKTQNYYFILYNNSNIFPNKIKQNKTRPLLKLKYLEKL